MELCTVPLVGAAATTASEPAPWAALFRWSGLPQSLTTSSQNLTAPTKALTWAAFVLGRGQQETCFAVQLNPIGVNFRKEAELREPGTPWRGTLEADPSGESAGTSIGQQAVCVVGEKLREDNGF